MSSQHTAGRETTHLAGWHRCMQQCMITHIHYLATSQNRQQIIYFFLNSIMSLTGSCQDHFTAKVLYLPLWPRVWNLQFENSRFDDTQSQNIIWNRVPTPGKSWKILNFYFYNFYNLESPGKWIWYWKVLEIKLWGLGKSWSLLVIQINCWNWITVSCTLYRTPCVNKCT